MLVATSYTEISALPGNRDPSGDGSSRASSNPPRQLPSGLSKIYNKNFGGKDRGRFQISREGMREISGRRRLEETTVRAIINEAYEQGFVVTEKGEDFSVIEEDMIKNYRKVPKKITAGFASVPARSKAAKQPQSESSD
jgi:hypothetical protein